MDNSWVMLRRDSKGWIPITVSLLVSAIAAYELLHPGAMYSTISDFIADACNTARVW